MTKPLMPYKPHITKRDGRWILMDLFGNDSFDTLELAMSICKYRQAAWVAR